MAYDDDERQRIQELMQLRMLGPQQQDDQGDFHAQDFEGSNNVDDAGRPAPEPDIRQPNYQPYAAALRSTESDSVRRGGPVERPFGTARPEDRGIAPPQILNRYGAGPNDYAVQQTGPVTQDQANLLLRTYAFQQGDRNPQFRGMQRQGDVGDLTAYAPTARSQQFDVMQRQMQQLPVGHAEQIRYQRLLNALAENNANPNINEQTRDDMNQQLMTGINPIHQRLEAEKERGEKIKNYQMMQDAGLGGQAAAVRLREEINGTLRNVPLAGGGQTTLVSDGRGGVQQLQSQAQEMPPNQQAALTMTKHQVQEVARLNKETYQAIHQEAIDWERMMSDYRKDAKEWDDKKPADRTGPRPEPPDRPPHLATAAGRRAELIRRVSDSFRGMFGEDMPLNNDQQNALLSDDFRRVAGPRQRATTTASTEGGTFSSPTQGGTGRVSQPHHDVADILDKPARLWSDQDRQTLAANYDLLPADARRRLGVAPPAQGGQQAQQTAAAPGQPAAPQPVAARQQAAALPPEMAPDRNPPFREEPQTPHQRDVISSFDAARAATARPVAGRGSIGSGTLATGLFARGPGQLDHQERSIVQSSISRAEQLFRQYGSFAAMPPDVQRAYNDTVQSFQNILAGRQRVQRPRSAFAENVAENMSQIQ